MSQLGSRGLLLYTNRTADMLVKSSQQSSQTWGYHLQACLNCALPQSCHFFEAQHSTVVNAHTPCRPLHQLPASLASTFPSKFSTIPLMLHWETACFLWHCLLPNLKHTLRNFPWEYLSHATYYIHFSKIISSALNYTIADK